MISNQKLIVAMHNFRVAYDFMQKCKNDDSSPETGAYQDAAKWLSETEAELYSEIDKEFTKPVNGYDV